jgi:hypothetical protein
MVIIRSHVDLTSRPQTHRGDRRSRAENFWWEGIYLKGECIRPGTPLSLEDARRLMAGYIEHYNNVRLNSAICLITPKDMLAGRQEEIHAERDRSQRRREKQRQIRRSRLREERRSLSLRATEASSANGTQRVLKPDCAKI